MHSLGAALLLFFTLVLVYGSAQIPLSGYALVTPRYKWITRVLEHEKIPTNVVTTSRKYFLNITIGDWATGIIDSYATRRFMIVGLMPYVTLLSGNCIRTSSINSNWQRTYAPDPTNIGWLVPFITTDTSCVATFSITSNMIALSLVDTVQNVMATVSVSELHWSIAPGRYENLLGEAVSPHNTSIARQLFDGNSLTLFSLADRTPLWFAYVNPNVPYLFVSTDEFSTYETIRLDSHLFVSSTPVCNNSNDPLLKHALALPGFVLINTRFGVVQGTVTPKKKAMHWKMVIASCIHELTSTEQQLPYQNGVMDSYVIALGSSLSVYLMTQERSQFTKLKDKHKRELGEFLITKGVITQLSADMRCIAATVSAVFIEDILVLVDLGSAVQVGSRYLLVQYSLSDRTWSVIFQFPRRLPVLLELDGAVLTSGVFAENYTASGVPLELHSMRYVRGQNTFLFFWGTALLFSPNGGNSVYAQLTFNGTTVSDFVSRNDGVGSFIVRTSDNQCWFGQANSVVLLRICTDMMTSRESSMRRIVFSNTNALFEIAIAANGSSVIRDDSVGYDLQDRISQETFQQGLICPYEALVFNASHDSEFTRSPQFTLVPTSSLPTHVYLNYGEEYTINMELSPSADGKIPLEHLRASFLLPTTNFISVVTARTVDAVRGRVKYTITIADSKRVIESRPPGEQLRPSPLTIAVHNATFACLDGRKSGAVMSAVSRTLLIYSGCPPGKTLQFDPKLSVSSNQGCENTDDVTCVYFEEEFTPRFVLADHVTGTQREYKGRYYLEIVAAGPSRDDLRTFTKSERAEFNIGGANSVWVRSDGSTHKIIDHNHNALSWTCKVGSPCYNVPPMFPKTPRYYFKVVAYTGGADMNYCNYSTEFYIMVHGLQMEFVVSIAATLVTVGIGLVLVGALFFYQYRKNPDDFRSADSASHPSTVPLMDTQTPNLFG